MSTKPQGAAEPRPNNEPYYIDSKCKECGTKLVLKELHENEDVDKDEIWHDEWICPKCPNTVVHMDVPDDYMERIKEIDKEDTRPLEELEL